MEKYNFLENSTISSLKFIQANLKFKEIAESARKELGEEFHTNAIKFNEISKYTRLYKLIKELPKGGLLHHHLILYADPEYI